MLFFKFADGAPSPVDSNELSTVLSQLELKITDRYENTSQVVGDIESIGSDVAIGYEGSEIIEVSIDRPAYSDRFYDLASRLIADLEMCMIPSFGGAVYHPPNFNLDEHLPDEFEAERISVSTPAALKQHLET